MQQIKQVRRDLCCLFRGQGRMQGGGRLQYAPGGPTSTVMTAPAAAAGTMVSPAGVSVPVDAGGRCCPQQCHLCADSIRGAAGLPQRGGEAQHQTHLKHADKILTQNTH